MNQRFIDNLQCETALGNLYKKKIRADPYPIVSTSIEGIVGNNKV